MLVRRILIAIAAAVMAGVTLAGATGVVSAIGEFNSGSPAAQNRERW